MGLWECLFSCSFVFPLSCVNQPSSVNRPCPSHSVRVDRVSSTTHNVAVCTLANPSMDSTPPFQANSSEIDLCVHNTTHKLRTGLCLVQTVEKSLISRST